MTPFTVQSVEQLCGELEEIRRAGVAISRQEAIVGVGAVAAGIMNMHGDTIAALNVAFNRALETPLVRKRLEEAAVVPLGGPPERMGAHVKSEVARWREVIRAGNIRAD